MSNEFFPKQNSFPKKRFNFSKLEYASTGRQQKHSVSDRSIKTVTETILQPWLLYGGICKPKWESLPLKGYINTKFSRYQLEDYGAT